MCLTMIKVKYPVSGAALGSDVEGVGPNVVLKQMYYRDNTHGWTSAELEIRLPSPLSLFFLTRYTRPDFKSCFTFKIKGLFVFASHLIWIYFLLAQLLFVLSFFSPCK